MGLFSPRRDPTDPSQLRIAVHELGHAVVWLDGGFEVSEVVHSGDSGYCDVHWNPENAHAYLAGFWGGLEAEDRWSSECPVNRGRRANSGGDIAAFRDANRRLHDPITERTARDLARVAVGRHWQRIETLAPQLIETGRLTSIRL